MSSSDLDEAAKRAAKAVQGSGKSERRQSAGQRLRHQLRDRTVQMLVVVAAIAALSWAMGSLITPRTGAVLFVLLVLGSVATNRVGTFSFSFALTAVAVIGLVFHFVLPGSVAAAFAPLTELVARGTGIDVGQIDAWRFALFAVVTVVLVWVVDIRITSAFRRQSGRPEAANADTVARALSRRVQDLFEDYVNIGVAFGFLMFALVSILLSGIGDLGGQILDVVAQTPVLAAALFNWFAGVVALGADVPILGDVPVLGAAIDALAGMSASGYGLLAGAVILLAWFARRNQD